MWDRKRISIAHNYPTAQTPKSLPDPRNPKKIKHSLTLLMLYGLLMFVFQLSSRREANSKMTNPQFKKNLSLLFPELDDLPHAD